MSRLAALTGKMKMPITLRAYDGTSLELELNFAKVNMLSEITPFLNKKEGDEVKKEHMDAFLKISRNLLKNNVPDATNDEIDEVIFQNIDVLVNAFKNMLNKSVERLSVDDKKKLVEEVSKSG